MTGFNMVSIYLYALLKSYSFTKNNLKTNKHNRKSSIYQAIFQDIHIDIKTLI